MKTIGIVLVVLGILALGYGGFGYTRDRKILEVGGLKATATEHKTVPIPAIAGIISLLGGIGLVVADKRRA